MVANPRPVITGCQELFGPDICYYDNAFGQSSNAIFNPIQTGGVNNGLYAQRHEGIGLPGLKNKRPLMVSALMQQNIMNIKQQKIGYTTFQQTPHLQMVLIA